MPEIYCLPERRALSIQENQTVLAALLAHDIPHAHACGGNAYCSTCRVMILEGIESCSAPTTAERALNKKLQFPVHVRLACQTRVTGNIAIRRMVVDAQDLDIVERQMAEGTEGGRQQVALLMVGVRSDHTLDEGNFYYDLIYILRRYFLVARRVLQPFGGIEQACIGNDLLVKFSLDEGAEPVARAIWAALELLRELEGLNQHLQQLSYSPLQLTMGIHYGVGVVMNLGATQGRAQHVVGRLVDEVQRIELANRKTESQLLVSEAAWEMVRDRVVSPRNFNVVFGGDRDRECRVFEVTAVQGEPPVVLPAEPPESRSLPSRIAGFMKRLGEIRVL
ncbi:MAG: 2Fe-2S iron-sulfur cluster binding domain-containing protein [Oscillatoriales cyanobacterium SM2_2_1]|nr:2Fe-2S iron-sulfur cluster binding domain-containing protein [Oscillatoriales cyanobacterium SM2_2_1]